MTRKNLKPIKNPGKMVTAKQKKFLIAFEKTQCNMAKSCRMVGISNDKSRQWLILYPKFAQAIEDKRNQLLDDMEFVISDAAMNGDTNCAEKFLRAKGRSRGWGVQSQEISAEISGTFDLKTLIEGLDEDEDGS